MSMDKKIQKYLNDDTVVNEALVRFKINDSVDATRYVDKLVSNMQWIDAFFNDSTVKKYLTDTDDNFGSNLVTEYTNIKKVIKDAYTKIHQFETSFNTSV